MDVTTPRKDQIVGFVVRSAGGMFAANSALVSDDSGTLTVIDKQPLRDTAEQALNDLHRAETGIAFAKIYPREIDSEARSATGFWTLSELESSTNAEA